MCIDDEEEVTVEKEEVTVEKEEVTVEKEEVTVEKEAYYCLPIIPIEPIDKDRLRLRHQSRREACLSEMLGLLAALDQPEVSAILTTYGAALLQKADGARHISLEFPQKRFY